jgi:Domain of unknown function (DUF4349)
MTSSPDLVREIATEQPAAPSSWTRWRLPIRRGALIAVPAAAALAFASAGVLGLARSDAPARESLEGGTPAGELAQVAPATSDAGKAAVPLQGVPDATTGARAQRVGATLTVEVKDSDAVSRAAQDALELTRSLGGYAVSSSVATGEQGNASLTVRVPVGKVQQAITGLSGLGRIVSQQVTIDDLQQTLRELERREAKVRSEIARIRARLETEDLDAQTEAVLRSKLQTLRAELPQLRAGISSTEAEARMSTIQLSVVTEGASGEVAPPSRLDRAVDEALNVLAWEGVIALGMLIVLAPFALVALVAWLGHRLYRRHEEERLLAT